MWLCLHPAWLLEHDCNARNHQQQHSPMVGASATTLPHIQGLLTCFVLSVPQTVTVHIRGVRCLWPVECCCSSQQKRSWCLLLHMEHPVQPNWGFSDVWRPLGPTTKCKTEDGCSRASGLYPPETPLQLRLDLSKVFMVLNEAVARLRAADAP